MFGGMVAVLIGWTLVGVALMGFGLLMLRAIGREPRGAEDAFTAFWLGYLASVSLLQAINLFAPVGAHWFWGIFALGLLGCGLQRAAIGRALARWRAAWTGPTGRTALLHLLGAIGLLWASNRAMAVVTPQGDAGLYHVGAIRWMQSHRLLPGIGNVDGNFAYNNGTFPWLGMLDLFGGPPHFFSLGFPVLLIVFTAQTLLYLGRAWRQGTSAPAHVYLGASWPAALVPYYFLELASTGTDTTTMILGMLVGISLTRMIFEPLDARDMGFQAFFVFALSCVGLTIKLSFAFLGFFACLVAAWLFARSCCGGEWSGVRAALRPHAGRIVGVLVMAVLVVGIWCARGFVQSGYIAFPSNTVVLLDVDWRMPRSVVEEESLSIEAWARYPVSTSMSDREVLEKVDWLLPWLLHTIQRVDLFTAPMLVFLVMIPIHLRALRRSAAMWRDTALLLGPAAIAFVLWFVTAPAERFGGAIFWLLGAGLMTAHFAQCPGESSRIRMVRAQRVIVATTLLAAFVASSILSGSRYGWPVFVAPGQDHGFHPIPVVETRPFETDSGVVLNVPVSAESDIERWQPGPFCWDAERPCTLYPRSDLETRMPGRFDAGFRVRSPD